MELGCTGVSARAKSTYETEGRTMQYNTPKRSDEDVLIAEVLNSHSERVRVEIANLSFATRDTLLKRTQKNIPQNLASNLHP